MTKFAGLGYAALLLLTACSGLHSRAPAVQTYLLKIAPDARPAETPASMSPPGANAAAMSIEVSRPQARPGLDTERIATVRGRSADYYAGAQWTGQLPDMIESLIIDRLRAADHWPVVEGSRSAFPAEYLLQVRLSSFEAQYSEGTAAPRVVVSMQCILGRRIDREVLGEFSAQASASADANRLGAVVAAFETATNAALDQLEAQAWAAANSRDSQKVPSPVDSSRR